jgi:hypothetical protein
VHIQSRSRAVGAAILFSMGLATTVAARPLFLTGAQEAVIVEAIGKVRNRAALRLPGYEARVGKVVPASLPLRRLPRAATNRVPSARGYAYAVLPDQVLIVNTKDRRVVAIITR